jgi:opacity protein-like surface antigen
MAADPGPYVSIDAGVNLVPDVDVTLRDPLVTVTGQFEFDPGVRFGVAGGYRFTPIFAAELETGFIYNELKDNDDITLSHIPFLANAVFRFENSTPLIPFMGVGAGGIASFFDIDNDDFDEDESDGDVVFAWQAFAGLHYKINDHMSAGITYKYLGADGPEFDIQGTGVEFDTVHNHSILASFNWAF